MNDKLILVTGTTGKQGGAMVSHAMQRGFAVRALTRNPNQPAGEALQAKGVDVFQNTPRAVERELGGCGGQGRGGGNGRRRGRG